jgi:ABC-type proline/glycine betaine transport system substrate-binding protein
MEHTAVDFAKGMYGPDEVFNADVVKELLKDHGITVDFTPMEILSVWEKGE